MEIKVNFYNMWQGHPRTKQDLSNRFEDVYKEIAPYTKDENGKFLNETSEPMLIKTGQIDVQEKIQSYLDDCDIYKILQKAAMADDMSLLNRQAGFYGDISAVPTNYNDFADLVDASVTDLMSLPKEISSLIIKDDYSEEALKEAIAKYNEKNAPKEEKEEVKNE